MATNDWSLHDLEQEWKEVGCEKRGELNQKHDEHKTTKKYSNLHIILAYEHEEARARLWVAVFARFKNCASYLIP